MRVFPVCIVVAAFVVSGTLPVEAWGVSHMGTPEAIEEWAEHGKKEVRTGISVAPILAFEPTFGTIFGGALFLDRPRAPKYRQMARAGFSTEGEYSLRYDLKRWQRENTFFHLETEVDTFARPYYGEGMETDAGDRIMLEGAVTRALYFLKCRRRGKLTMGPFLDYRGANLKSVEGTRVPRPEYDEASLGLGFCLFYDSRDSQLSPTSGLYDVLTFRLVPDGLSAFEDSRTFFQAEVDHRNFLSPSAGLVLGWRFYAAGTWGRPSYQYRYSLGGPYALRGFFNNRFRGDKAYAGQVTIRRDVTRIMGSMVSAAAFAELGEAADGWFGGPETSFGGGLRFTLPPDHVAKVRFDLAWARDQRSFYFIFGEAF